MIYEATFSFAALRGLISSISHGGIGLGGVGVLTSRSELFTCGGYYHLKDRIESLLCTVLSRSALWRLVVRALACRFNPPSASHMSVFRQMSWNSEVFLGLRSLWWSDCTLLRMGMIRPSSRYSDMAWKKGALQTKR